MDSSWTLQKIAHPVSVPEDELDLTAYLRPNAGPGERTAEGLQVIRGMAYACVLLFFSEGVRE